MLVGYWPVRTRLVAYQLGRTIFQWDISQEELDQWDINQEELYYWDISQEDLDQWDIGHQKLDLQKIGEEGVGRRIKGTCSKQNQFALPLQKLLQP